MLPGPGFTVLSTQDNVHKCAWQVTHQCASARCVLATRVSNFNVFLPRVCYCILLVLGRPGSASRAACISHVAVVVTPPPFTG